MTGCFGAILIVVGVRMIIEWVMAFLDWDGAPAVLFGVFILWHVFAIWYFVRICKKAIRAENLRAMGLPSEGLTNDEDDMAGYIFLLLLAEGCIVVLIIGARLGFIGS